MDLREKRIAILTRWHRDLADDFVKNAPRALADLEAADAEDCPCPCHDSPDHGLYPHEEGGVTVIGPECFTKDGSVLAWRGENYVRQPEPEGGPTAPEPRPAKPQPRRRAAQPGNNRKETK